MKNKRLALLIALLLVLPMVLAACGGGPAGNAKKFLEAGIDGDKEEAEKYVCDDPDPIVQGMLDEIGNDDDDSDDEVDKIECEEDGDDVKCTLTPKDDDQEDVEITFSMKDDKVCGLKLGE